MRWERLKLVEEGGGPGKRWGHTCNAIGGGKLLYLFGGYGKHKCQTNQVHVFDTGTRTWSEPTIKGKPPTPRDSHSCTAVGDNLYVFGGTDGLNPLRDLHILDTTSNTWISPSLRGDGPDAREGHSAALMGKRLFIFGGCGKSMNNLNGVYYNDLHILDTETFVWQHAVTSGTPPVARDSHTCSSWSNKIIVIGGEDEHDYYLSDVHVLDTDTLVWSELNTSGRLLPPRAGHSTVAFGKHMFVFGGFSDAQNLYDDLYMLDVETGVWTKIMPTGEGPSARFSVSGDCLYPSMGGVLAFIGGCNKNLEALDDMYLLHTEIVREIGRDEQRLEKLSLRKQLKMKCQEQYLPSPVNDRALVTVETADRNSDTSVPIYSQKGEQRFHLNSYRPLAGKRTFMAKVVQNISTGVIVETVIDGKPLRGILFSTKTSNDSAFDVNSNRKRDAVKAESMMNCGEKDMTSHVPQGEAANAEAGPSREVWDGNPAPSKRSRLNHEEDKTDETSDTCNLPQENAPALRDTAYSPQTEDGRTLTSEAGQCVQH